MLPPVWMIMQCISLLNYLFDFNLSRLTYLRLEPKLPKFEFHCHVMEHVSGIKTWVPKDSKHHPTTSTNEL
ncbi:hypothetical protein QVD17_17191 [Tagetes erecta]|uniref:Uncharacterized protein n=1 Tax=Tagetes erecta TaxID=13708 RepID=A0AAD8P054_TARER|nr:hypothetical protein QVD17_17191 [Tagetes erecta]